MPTFTQWSGDLGNAPDVYYTLAYVVDGQPLLLSLAFLSVRDALAWAYRNRAGSEYAPAQSDGFVVFEWERLADTGMPAWRGRVLERQEMPTPGAN